jgi:alcohol dehydrogenase
MQAKHMKALVYTANEEMTYRDEPEPSPRPGDALVAIESVGICGSDMHAYLGHDERRVPPLILGHEAVGTVLEGELGGRRVVLNPLITCGVCDACLGGRQNLCAARDLIGMYRAGAFAEKIAIPARNLIPVPDGMPSAHAALTEPGATGLHAVLLAERVVARPLSEARALVVGAGSVGLLTALILRDKGVEDIVVADTNPLRRELVAGHCDFELIAISNSSIRTNRLPKSRVSIAFSTPSAAPSRARRRSPPASRAG